MVLRLTIAEFRKIPSNDKLLFGILIAIIVFNSMVPRVVEGLPEKYFSIRILLQLFLKQQEMLQLLMTMLFPFLGRFE